MAALATMGQGELRQLLSAGSIALWSLKLSGFLLYRVLQTKHDLRLSEILSTNSGAFGFWFISAVWGSLVILQHVLSAGIPVGGRPRFGALTDVLGLILFLFGTWLETEADRSKWDFKTDPMNKGKFCDVGVWKSSQHPNWAGNLILWTGIWLLNAQTLCAAPRGRGVAFLLAGALSPLFLLALFYGQATDRIAGQMALADARYGADPAYRAWRESTPLVLPNAQSILRAFS